MNIKKSSFTIIVICAIIGGIAIGTIGPGLFGTLNIGWVSVEKSEYESLKEIEERYTKAEYLLTQTKEKYYKDVDEKDLESYMYKGIFEGLGDPYSSYLTKEEMEQWTMSLTGEYDGIGVTISANKKGEIEVVSVEDGSPAKKAGIIVPSIPTINTSSGLENGVVITPEVSGGGGSWRTVGFFGRINYNFKERYLAEVNLRYDGSSRFRSDNRWGFFPSFSLGWNIANEPFFKPAKRWVDMLKIRASYGSLGNQNTTSWYPTYQTMGFANSSGDWLINGQKPNTAWPPALISMLLTWEKVRSWNAGIDFAAFDSRLTGSFEYFIRQTLDMVGPADELPVILGTSVPSTNNTDLQTEGWELELSWRDVAFGQLNYGIRLVLSDAQATILKYSNPSRTLDKNYAGMKVGEIWGYETVGIAKSDIEMRNHLATLPYGGQNAIGSDWGAGDIMYKDVNGDGVVDSGANTIDDHGDLKVIGNTTPRYNFGIDLTAAWKGIDLRIFLQGVGKRDYYQGSMYFYGTTGASEFNSMALSEHIDYFRADADNPLGQNLDAYYPKPYFNTNKNTRCQTGYLQNAAYCRLKNVQIGYTIPQKYTSKIGISNCRVYLSGENLATFTQMTDLFDPETIGANSAGNVYPLTRTYSVGLSVTF